MDLDQLEDTYRELMDKSIALSKKDIRAYAQMMKMDYDLEWFHKVIYDYLQLWVDKKIKKLAIFVPPQHGKALPIYTPVWTTCGWKEHGDLKEGDFVIGADGKPKRVLANLGISPVECLEMDFGTFKMHASEHHLWKLQCEKDDHNGRFEELVMTEQIFSRYEHRRNPFVRCAPTHLGYFRGLPIDPYILGCWLGDGTSDAGHLTVGTQDIEHFKKYGVATYIEKANYYRVRILELRKSLRLNGILNNKHIPHAYLTASKKQRIALLCGLMDTDGTIDKRGNASFTQKSGALVDDTETLIRTLGYKVRRREAPMKLNGEIVGCATHLDFNPNKDDIVFLLPRKAERLKNKTKKDRDDKYKFFLKSVSKERTRILSNCISVEGGMYLAGREMVPTHNSTMSSILCPSFILGRFPKAKIVVASYTKEVSSNFCRQTKDVMLDPMYNKIFPDTILPDSGVQRTNELSNSSYFETIKHKGFYKSVGVGTGLTSFTCEYGIIDDPIKDRKQANSAVYRESLWDWYVDVFRTRLNNKSCELLLFTRWHNDDIAGRLFDPLNEHYDEKEAKKWTVIVAPALKETEKAIEQQIDIADPRQVDEALWPDMHSADKHEDDRRTNPVKFASLKQQRPSPLGGNVIKKEGFVYMNDSEVPFDPEDVPMEFMIDGAFTDKTENDPSALIAYRVFKSKIYIYNCHAVRYNLPKFLPYVNTWIMSMDYDQRSQVKIELKASGYSFMQMMREEQYGGFNTEKINTVHVGWGKYNRAEASAPTVASEKVILINGSWNKAFVGQVINFPNDTHDDMLDLLCYCVLDNMDSIKGTRHKSSVNSSNKVVLKKPKNKNDNGIIR